MVDLNVTSPPTQADLPSEDGENVEEHLKQYQLKFGEIWLGI